MKWLLASIALAGSLALQGFQRVEIRADEVSPKRKDKLVLTESEWKKRLTPEQYRILRSQGTEPAFCGVFVDNKKKGIYSCVGCGLDLFRSDAKFDSGTGWPSFFQPVAKDVVWTKTDCSHGMVRLEVLCARCDGHLGHVFPDGPRPTGLRYCINSEILKFRETK
ncbi:MAG TPA: peptide-methionine (R)-S-oxide reductase MsrB [Fimbriimonadaceae bacterium]|nr:peptide-methionine (R)-S-oxide reductase MsrB [Fimbriimonadaceae bacterium]